VLGALQVKVQQEVQSKPTSSTALSSNGTVGTTSGSGANSASTDTATAGSGVATTGIAKVELSIVITTVRSVSSEGQGLIRVEVPAALKGEMRFVLPEADRSLLTAAGRPYARGMDDKPLPSWLQFNGDQIEFSAVSVPNGALPITVQVISGTRRTIVVIEHFDGKGQ
jgi:hypothetical protein